MALYCLVPEQPLSATQRIAVCSAMGVLGAAIAALLGPWWIIPLAAWAVAALAFLVWMWRTLDSADAATTAARAQREDPSRATADVLLLSASLVSLLAVGLVLVRASRLHGLDKGLLVGAAVLSIALAWGVVHSVFTLRYARLYYHGRPHGVDFNEDDLPAYTDSAYLALTIGLTFQVSDSDLQTKPIRRLALRHALLSYMFGSLIVASTVNLVAGLGK